jgi:hypothetical protein
MDYQQRLALALSAGLFAMIGFQMGGVLGSGLVAGIGSQILVEICCRRV